VVAVGILMLYVILSEILLLPVSCCHLGFSTQSSVDHDCWTFRCFVHSHKPLYWFWTDIRICKNSEVITTSGNLAAMLDFWHTSTSHEVVDATTRKLDSENVGIMNGTLEFCRYML